MNQTTNAARAADMEERAAACLAQAGDTALSVRTQAGLRSNAVDLRTAAARLRGAASAQNLPAAPDIVAGPAPTPAPGASLPSARASSSGFAHLTREQKLERIAAGAPFALPSDMLAKAAADETSPTEFALAVANYCVIARAAANEEQEVEALVASILRPMTSPAGAQRHDRTST